MSIKEKIKDVSLDLFVEYGVHATSIKMITEKAEISNGAIFHHFATKDDILVALYKDIKLELLDKLYEAVLDISYPKHFLYEYYKTLVLWGLSNSSKKLFINMFAFNPKIRSCTDFLDGEKLQYINGYLQKAIDLEEIAALDLELFLMNILANTDSVIKYLSIHSDKEVDATIDFMFKQFYRSIIII